MAQTTADGRYPLRGSGQSAEPEPLSSRVSAQGASVPNALKLFPAGPGDNAQPVQFPALHEHVALRGGGQGRYFGRCPITRCHRLGVLSRVSQPDKPVYDIWLLDDCGRNRCSPGPSAYDYLPAVVQS